MLVRTSEVVYLFEEEDGLFPSLWDVEHGLGTGFSDLIQARGWDRDWRRYEDEFSVREPWGGAEGWPDAARMGPPGSELDHALPVELFFRQVSRATKEQADAFGSHDIETEHVLLGVLAAASEGEPLARRLDTTLAEVERALLRITGLGDDRDVKPLSGSAISALIAARHRARDATTPQQAADAAAAAIADEIALGRAPVAGALLGEFGLGAQDLGGPDWLPPPPPPPTPPDNRLRARLRRALGGAG